MQRRELIRAAPASLLGAMVPSIPVAAQSETTQPVSPSMLPASYATFDDWVQAARAAALQLAAESGAKDTERFMRFLALWTAAMPDPVAPEWQTIAGANQRLDAAILAKGRPFVAGALKLAPGCVVPVHCHPSGGAVSVCIAGSLWMQHYDLAEGAAAYTETGAEVAVDEVASVYLTRNQFTQFTPTRANLHTLRAGPEGAVVVEISVQWAGTGELSYLKLHDTAPDEATSTRRRRGSWVGMDIALAYS